MSESFDNWLDRTTKHIQSKDAQRQQNPASNNVVQGQSVLNTSGGSALGASPYIMASSNYSNVTYVIRNIRMNEYVIDIQLRANSYNLVYNVCKDYGLRFADHITATKMHYMVSMCSLDPFIIETV